MSPRRRRCYCGPGATASHADDTRAGFLPLRHRDGHQGDHTDHDRKVSAASCDYRIARSSPHNARVKYDVDLSAEGPVAFSLLWEDAPCARDGSRAHLFRALLERLRGGWHEVRFGGRSALLCTKVRAAGRDEGRYGGL